MKKCFWCIAATVLTVAASLQAAPSDLKKTAAATLDQDQGAISFDGEKYSLGERMETATQEAYEYIRPWETMERWTKRLAVRWIPFDQDPLDYAQAVEQAVMRYNPDARTRSESRQSGAEAVVQYQQWDPGDPETPLELHILQVLRRPPGLLIKEFTYRSSDKGPSALVAFREEIKQARTNWYGQLIAAHWPIPSVKPEIARHWTAASQAVKLFEHRPDIFVERSLGPLPADLSKPAGPTSKSWSYARSAQPLELGSFDFFVRLLSTHRIPGLDVSGQPKISDDDLQKITVAETDWPIQPGWRSLADGLRYLNLLGSGVTAQAAEAIAKMVNLQILFLNDAMTDAALKSIGTLQHLVELRPGGALITDKGLEALKDLRWLGRLDLSDTSVTDKGLKQLNGLPLIELRLGSKITDTGLKTVADFSTLQQLDLTAAHVTDKGLLALKKLPHLSTVFLGEQLTDSEAPALSSLTSLRRLDLTGAKITDAAIPSLASLVNLEELALSQTGIDDQGLAALLKLPRLRFLEISDTKVTLDGIRQLAALNTLDVLSFSYMGKLTLGDLKPLGRLPRLRTLIINGAPLNAAAMDYLRNSQKQSRGWTVPWLTLAFADSLPPQMLGDSTEIGDLTEEHKPSGMHTGLRRIHEVESDLDHIIPAASDPNQDVPAETEKNFLGEFEVNSGGSKTKHDH